MNALYLHVPFCTRKCDYCAFHSVPELELIDQYLERLGRQAEQLSKRCGPLQSVYIGGGTPNALSPSQLATLLTHLRTHFRLVDDCEFSIEGNPASNSREKLEICLEYGVNRFSVGVQTFNDAFRQGIGRAGSADDARTMLKMLNAMGVDNVSADLISGLPGQDLDAWRADLRELLAYAPAHVSAYSLTVEPATPVAARADEVEERLFESMWHATDVLLERGGLRRYEISNFAKAGRECRHNMDIWHGERFLGLGPSAHWFDGNSRWANPPLQPWLTGEAPAEDHISERERAVEILIVGLRTLSGWTNERFQLATGFDFMELRGAALEQLAKKGLLTLAEKAVFPTNKGLLLNDYLGTELL